MILSQVFISNNTKKWLLPYALRIIVITHGQNCRTPNQMYTQSQKKRNFFLSSLLSYNFANIYLDVPHIQSISQKLLISAVFA